MPKPNRPDKIILNRGINSVLVVILNWNGLKYTNRCLNSFVQHQYRNFRILVIDNASSIDPTPKLKGTFPELIIIRNDRNLGVAGGRNVGIKYALENNFKYILFFDNDAFADSQLLYHLTNAADEFPNAALFGPKIYVDNDGKTIWRAGCTSWKWTYLHAGFKLLNHFFMMLNIRAPTWIDTGRGENQIDFGQYNEVRNISFQIGCAQLIRTEVFEDVGLLDTEYSPYGSEDIDFCARLSEHGWKIKYIPKAICWHRVESSFNDSFERNYFNTRNIILLARKHLNPFYFGFLFLPDFLLLTIPLFILRSLLLRRMKDLHGFLAGVNWNIRDIRKRGLILKHRPRNHNRYR